MQLFDRIVNRGHYSEKDAAELASKLAQAFLDLHSAGIIHRYAMSPVAAAHTHTHTGEYIQAHACTYTYTCSQRCV